MPKEKLFNILREKIVELQPQNGEVLLTEPNNVNRPGTLKEVHLVGIPGRELVLKPEHATITVVKEKDKYYNGHNLAKYRKKCDYIIITEFEGIGYIVYIEMKTSARSNEHIAQMWCARSLMEYLNFAIKNLDNLAPAFDTYLHRYVKFTCIPADKDPTGMDQAFKSMSRPIIVNDKPCNAYPCNVTDGKTVNLRDLIL